MDSLICLTCCNSLKFEPGSPQLICDTCGRIYPVVNSIPIILNEDKSIFKEVDFLDNKRLFFETGKLYKLVTACIPPLGINWTAKANYRYLSAELTKRYENLGVRPNILIIGGSIAGKGMSELLKNTNIDIIESDVSFGPRTKIIFDGHQIPFADNTFDLVICQAVLEHVISASKCVEEIYRVIKMNGMVYVETPFMQQVHGGPYDFTRYNHSGHRLLLKDFEEIKSGPSAFAGTAFFWSYYYLLLAVFGFNGLFRKIIKIFARFTGFIFILFDLLIMRKNQYDSASGFYFIGRKTAATFDYHQILKYYDAARK